MCKKFYTCFACCVLSVIIHLLPTSLFSPLQSSINDSADFKAVADAMKVIGFTGDEIQTVYKILATIIHLVITSNAKSLLISITNCVEPLFVLITDAASGGFYLFVFTTKEDHI